MWELYALAILDELKTRANLKTLSEFGLDILYARAKTKLWGKIERLRGVPELSVGDFGTRRRHSFLWQEYVVEAMAANLGNNFIGTSNAFLAHKHDLEAIGTNAHEIPMVMAALAPDDVALKASQYRVLELWQQTYEGALRVLLPDTFGTTQFLRDAPDWVAGWTGQRMDSKDPYVAGDEYIAWLKAKGKDPAEKLLIASDTLDVDQILGLHAYFGGSLGSGVEPRRFFQRGGFSRSQQVDAGAAHSVQRGLGHAADQRFSRLQSQCGRGIRSHQLDLQGFESRRPARSETLRQLFQGAGPGGGNRALPESVRDCGDRERAGGSVGRG